MPPDIREFRSDCPAALVDICVTMMQKDPKLRYRHMRDVADVLEGWVRNQATARGPDAARPALAPVQRRTAPVPPLSPPSLGSGSDVLRHPTRHPTAAAAGNAAAAFDASTPAAAAPPAPQGSDAGTLTTAASESSASRIDLGIEVLAGESSSHGTRLLLEQRRLREQHVNRIFRLVWLGLAVAALSLAAVLFGAWLLSDHGTLPTPPKDPGAGRPVLRPRT
jgi:hypothetical protein